MNDKLYNLTEVTYSEFRDLTDESDLVPGQHYLITDLVNKETPPEDFWIETPVGSFKNPTIIPEESELDNEITFTIKYDEWEQIKNKL